MCLKYSRNKYNVSRFGFWLGVLIFMVGLYSCSGHRDTGTEVLFDGQTFEGWEGSKDFFRIEDESIVAGDLTRTIPVNQFLCTEAQYGDFELNMRVQFTSTKNNAGIQIRTQRIPDDHEVIGYQSDIGYAGGKSVWGSLYDESRRNKFMAESDPNLIQEVVDVDGWNDYRIRCVGPRIQHWINNVEVLDFTEKDKKIAEAGKICVQIHSGVPAEAWYKDIRITELP